MYNLNILGNNGNQEVGKESSFTSIYDCFINDSVDGVKIDTRITGDKKIIVYHDKDFFEKRITSISSGDISRIGLDNNYHVCELETYLKLCNKKLLLNIKGSLFEYGIIYYKYYLEYLTELLKAYPELKISVESTNYRVLDYLKEKNPNLDTVLQIGDIKNNIVNREYDVDGLDYICNNITKEIVLKCLEKRIDLYSRDKNSSCENIKKIRSIIVKYGKEFDYEGLDINVINFLPEKTKIMLKK